MAAIKYTLSRDTSRRAPSVEAEAERLNKEGSLWYELNVKPQRADKDDLVYLIRNGAMLARARILDIAWKDVSEMGTTYTGAQVEKSCWRFEIKNIELAKRDIPHTGFQGFRYVTAKELPSFERAFKSSRRRRA
ncbi:MAG TPA: hypothetical protein VJR02_11005 [Pyrinomonadaceae bacterium]|nr:hypothetical protein [Pyrinomonadaceae bacterium]